MTARPACRLLATALLAALWLAPAPAALAAPAPAPAPAGIGRFSEEDLRLLYDEAAAIGATTYTYYMFGTDDEDAVRELDKKLSANPLKRRSLTAAVKLEAQKLRAFAAPPALREQLRQLGPGETSHLFQPDRHHWAIIELKAVDPRTPMPSYEMLRTHLPELVAVGALPEPAELRRDPDLVERRLMNEVNTPAQFDRLPPGFYVDRPLASGYTLLLRALARDQAPLVRAIVTRGANPNLCVMRLCPLQAAQESRENAALYTRLLLEAGAKPDQLPLASGQETALALAVHHGQREAARLLLEHGADPDARQAVSVPLEVALAKGDRELVQLLLDHGADPLRQRLVSGGEIFVTPLASVRAGGPPELVAWFRQALLRQLATRREYQWSGWIEQEVEKKVTVQDPVRGPVTRLVKTTVRTPLSAERITLQRKPFTLRLRLPAQAVLRLEAATGPQLAAELEQGDLDAPLFQRRRLQGAGPRNTLPVSEGEARAAAPERVGGLLAWAPAHKDFQVVRTAQGPEYLRRITRLQLDDGRGGGPLPLEKSRLREFTLVLGLGIDYNGQLGDLAGARAVTLSFVPAR